MASHNPRQQLTPRSVDEIDSHAFLGVAERVAEGRLSVNAAAETAANFKEDGCNKACLFSESMKTSVLSSLLLWWLAP